MVFLTFTLRDDDDDDSVVPEYIDDVRTGEVYSDEYESGDEEADATFLRTARAGARVDALAASDAPSDSKCASDETFCECEQGAGVCVPRVEDVDVCASVCAPPELKQPTMLLTVRSARPASDLQMPSAVVEPTLGAAPTGGAVHPTPGAPRLDGIQLAAREHLGRNMHGIPIPSAVRALGAVDTATTTDVSNALMNAGRHAAGRQGGGLPAATAYGALLSAGGMFEKGRKYARYASGGACARCSGHVATIGHCHNKSFYTDKASWERAAAAQPIAAAAKPPPSQEHSVLGAHTPLSAAFAEGPRYAKAVGAAVRNLSNTGFTRARRNVYYTFNSSGITSYECEPGPGGMPDITFCTQYPHTMPNVAFAPAHKIKM